MKAHIIFGKGFIASLCVWVSDFMGLLIPTFMLLTFLMILDYISGMLASKKEALEHPENPQYRWSSRKSIVGIYKKVGYILTVLVAVSTDYLIHKYAAELGLTIGNHTLFGLLVSIWLILNELISILENANRMGVTLPHFLVHLLVDLKNHVDDTTHKE